MKTLLPALLLLLLTACSSDQPAAKKTDSAGDTTAKKTDTVAVAEKNSSTFQLAHVTRNTKPLQTYPLKGLMAGRTGKAIYIMPERTQEQRGVPVYMNGFVQGVQYAYAEHRPLVISPDMVWLLIAQGFSIHINEKYDSLKSMVFTSDKPRDIIVRNDSLITGKAAEWEKTIASFSDSVKKYTRNDVYNAVIQKFSTTTPEITTAYNVTLLESVKKGFNFLAESGCGIPEITLTGTQADWDALPEKTEALRKFGLGKWVDNLKPVLSQFSAAYKGNVDTVFWNAMYKESSMYNIFHISGWMLKFFPYVKQYYTVGEGEDMRETFRYIPNKYYDGENYRLSTLSTEHFPSGYAKVDVKWSNQLKTPAEVTDLEVYAGFAGLKQDSVTLALEPIITWAICKKNAPAAQAPDRDYPKSNLKHTPDRWLSEIADKADVLPVYGYDKTTRTYAQGIKKLETFLRDTIAKLIPPAITTAPYFSFDFIVTWGGTVTDVKVHGGRATPEQEVQLKHLLTHLPLPWKPAERKEYDIDDDAGSMFSVNYRVHVSLNKR